MTNSDFSPQEELQYCLINNDIIKRHYAIGLLTSFPENPLLLTPRNMHNLVENDITVYLQRDYGSIHNISNLQYSDYGVEIIDDPINIIHQSQMILKYSPLTQVEYLSMDKNKILLSALNQSNISLELIHHFGKKNITAFALDLIKDSSDNILINKILQDTLSDIAATIAIGNLLVPLIKTLAFTTPIRSAIQTSPKLLQSVYCYCGQVCNRDIAEIVQVPWKDILGLCWDWN